MKYSKQTRIAVLLGGLSKEREISLRTGQAAAKALRGLGYQNVHEIDVARDVAQQLALFKSEVAFVCLHGRYGEDGSIQGILEYLGIPYTGASVLASAVAMDKALTKVLLEKHGVPTPAWRTYTSKTPTPQLTQEVLEYLGLPAVAKPLSEGSTIGLSIVREVSEIEAAQNLALSCEKTVLWERFIQGTELTVSVLGEQVLPVVEIVPRSGLYDYESKYTKGKTEYFCPARISDAHTRIVQKVAREAYEALGVRSYARIDVLMDSEGPWVLEVNTIPGMTETSLLPKAAQAAGISFESLVERILESAALKIGASG